MSDRVIDNIERLMKERGWSMRRLACNMSMPKHRLARVLNGEENPSREKLERIAKAFGVSVLALHRPSSRDEKTYTIDNDGTLNWH